MQMMYNRSRYLISIMVLSLCLRFGVIVSQDTDLTIHGDIEAVIDRKDELLCKISSDCQSDRFVCHNQRCVGKNLFPLSQSDIICSLSTFAAIAFASGGGIGGGGLLVPLYMLVLQMTPHDAIPLSKATIFGGAVASFIINARRSHPVAKNRPLIDYEIVMMLEPMTLAGTVLGVYLNAVLPSWIITLFLVILTFQAVQKTYAKGMTVLRKENDRDLAILHDAAGYWKNLLLFKIHKEMELGYIAVRKWKNYKRRSAVNIGSSVSPIASIEMVTINSAEKLLHEEPDIEHAGLISQVHKGVINGYSPTLDDIRQARQRVPWGDLGALFLTWATLFIMSVLKGGHGTPSLIGLECGGVWYWAIIITAVPFFVSVTSYFGSKTRYRHSLMIDMGYEYADGDVVWTKDAILKYPAICCLAGMAAGMLGIGGGMVQGPLFLHMGVLPEVASATSSTMILFTSSATTLQFIVLGMLKWDYVIWFCSIGFIAGLIGQIFIDYLVRKYRKSSYIIFPMVVFIGLSGIVMGGLGVSDVIDNGFGGFRSLCRR